MTTTTDTPPPGWYFRRGQAWIRVSDPRIAPKGVRLWTANELQVLPDGRLQVKGRKG